MNSISSTLVLLLLGIADLAKAQEACAGICLVEGESLLNGAEDVSIENTMATCLFYDEENKDLTDPAQCQANADAAIAAGCKCGVPIECAGICTVEGESLLNAAEDVTVENSGATCGAFDATFQEVIDGVACAENAQKAQDAGCRCGVPVVCPGICPEGETMTNEGVQVNIENTAATCGFYNTQNQEEIDGEVCQENAAKAKEAGCTCTGTFPPTPAPAPGISSASLSKKMALWAVLAMIAVTIY